ncbi:MAG: hypothetical protein ACLPPF_15670 [Rhodomicrobium sp.]
MTREIYPAAQSAARRAASLLTGALLIAGLAGCGGSLFQNSDTADAALKAKPAVALSPVEGVPQKYASKVNDQLVASIKAKGVQIVEAKDAKYIIKPTYAAAPEPKHGTKVAYTINVTDKAGNKVRSITGEELVSPKRGGDSWAHVNEEGVQKVTEKSAVDVAAWISNPNAPAPSAMANASPAPAKVAANVAAKPAAAKTAAPATPTLAAAVETPAAGPAVKKVAAAPAEVIAVVPTVTGAPGDGKTSLAEAMKRALGHQGVKLASAAKRGTYKIQGSVELGAVAGGQQPITIRWVVVDPSGKQMEKTVIQNNRVVAGSLDGAWGDIADQAAGAAASEVSKLLQKPVAGAAQPIGGSAG